MPGSPTPPPSGPSRGRSGRSPRRRRTGRAPASGLDAGQWGRGRTCSSASVFAALDEPGGHVAAVVRVHSHAATGPHIAGMDLGDRDPLTGPAGASPRWGSTWSAAIDAAAAERALPGLGPTPLALPPGLAGPGADPTPGGVGEVGGAPPGHPG